MDKMDKREILRSILNGTTKEAEKAISELERDSFSIPIQWWADSRKFAEIKARLPYLKIQEDG